MPRRAHDACAVRSLLHKHVVFHFEDMPLFTPLDAVTPCSATRAALREKHSGYARHGALRAVPRICLLARYTCALRAPLLYATTLMSFLFCMAFSFYFHSLPFSLPMPPCHAALPLTPLPPPEFSLIFTLSPLRCICYAAAMLYLCRCRRMLSSSAITFSFIFRCFEMLLFSFRLILCFSLFDAATRFDVAI